MINKRYSKQVLCRGCNKLLTAKVLSNVYSKEVFDNNHVELVCVKCGYGNLVFLKDYIQELSSKEENKNKEVKHGIIKG
jgi:RNase P subunit RPR2